MKNGNPDQKVLDRCKLFHTDSIFTGISALALRTNAPTILKAEAMGTVSKGKIDEPKMGYSKCLGSGEYVFF